MKSQFSRQAAPEEDWVLVTSPRRRLVQLTI